MGKISIEESEHQTLTEKAGRVDDVLEENATLKARNTELEEAERRRTRHEKATEIVEARAKEAGVSYSGREVKGFLLELPLTEAGDLDEAAFTTAVDEDAAARKVAEGAGQPHGFGAPVTTPSGKTISLSDIDEALGLETQEA